VRSALLEERQTQWNTMAVVKVGDRIDLDVQGATYATWHPRQVLTGYSWDGLSLGCLLRFDGPPRSVLVLGLGGGTVTRQLRALLPDVRIVGVEIDDGVIDLARRWLHLDDSNVEVHVGDAYDFLARGTERFDAVIDDLFLTGAEDVVRSRIPEGDTLALVRSRVAPGGVVIANVITDVGPHQAVRRRARAAFRAGFASARVITPPRGLNEILVGGERTRSGNALPVWERCFADADDRALLGKVGVAPLPRRRDGRAPKATDAPGDGSASTL
jgi:predicted membrane-bound spermidine synthase